MVPDSPLRILIADDSDLIRQQLHLLLDPLDYAQVVDEAESAQEAIDRAAAMHPDVVVLDIEMPGSGISALKHIKRTQPDTVVIMLTNHAGPYYEKVCRRSGADFFLDKSIEFERVPAVLATIAAA